MTTIRARRYDTAEPVELIVRNDVVEIKSLVDLEFGEQSFDLPWLAPGLVDLQVNGFNGCEFNDPALTDEDVAGVTQALKHDGVVRYCPTVTTADDATLLHAMRVLSQAAEKISEVQKAWAGIHLEGPYLSPEDGPRGAHPREHCRPPDWSEFCRWQEAAGGEIRLVTLSPEYDTAPSFIAKATASGVKIAIGHTAATSEQITAAVDSGASLSTHLGNGAHGMIRRHPNYIWDQLADDRLFASLIVDGHHLPPSVVKNFVRGKTTNRCLLVSDVTGMAGKPPGRYETRGLGAVEVLEDGRLVVAGQRQYLAGAAASLLTGVNNVRAFAQVDLATAINMASVQPAKFIGCDLNVWETNAPCNLILLRETAGALHIDRVL